MPHSLTVNFCNRELIETTGNANLVFQIDEDENGCISVKSHFNTQNVTGVGLTTSDEYRIIDISNGQTEDVAVCEGCTLEFSGTSTWKVMAKDGTSYTSQASCHVILDFCTGTFTEIRFSGNGGCEETAPYRFASTRRPRIAGPSSLYPHP